MSRKAKTFRYDSRGKVALGGTARVLLVAEGKPLILDLTRRMRGEA